MKSGWIAMNNLEMRMGEPLCVVAESEDEGLRLDKFLSIRMEELTVQQRNASLSRERFPVREKSWVKNTVCIGVIKSK